MAPLSRRKGFTLVELLVVIGIIALLISILLPTLSNARRAAQTVACASNARQLALAIRLFAQEHRGYMPATSDKDHMWARDPQRKIWVYRSGTNPPVGLDWASSLLPYLGNRSTEWFNLAPDKIAKIFKCPSDEAQNIAGTYGTSTGQDPVGPGLLVFNNMSSPFGGFPISYGVNADIGSLVDNSNNGRFGQGTGDIMNVYAGPKGAQGYGLPMGAKLDKVKNSAEVLLVGDCGTRPRTGNPLPGLDRNDAVYYTTNFMASPGVPDADLGRLSGVAKASWLKDRIPYKRHKDKINIAFVDGHGETVIKGDERHVRVSPWQF
jgi:prepilin-type N-terminal cleavage/methylation domain-containing protein/prepilin-type processing-associated H-X9-DG protein